MQLLDSVVAGQVAAPGGGKRAASAGAYHGSTPPLSPKKATLGPLSPTRAHLAPSRLGPPAAAAAAAATPRARPEPRAGLPRFYFPAAEAPAHQLAAHVSDLLSPHGEALPLAGLRALLRDAFRLPACLAPALMARLAPGGAAAGALSARALREWLHAERFAALDPDARLFAALRAPGADHLAPADLRPLLAGVLAAHPGLAFLKDSPEFQERYAETVVHRIFFALDRAGAGRVSARAARRGGLLAALAALEGEEDVNRCARFFSYEHFYVIYCKFWDLDADHDFLLARDDLLRYANHALTYRVADRIFAQAARPFASGVPGRMGYEDFVWFILAEEDKAADAALGYWFRACDLDGDGALAPDELLWFYEEQLGRMECLSQETVAFEDVLVQMQDMLGPADPRAITLRDLRRRRGLAGTLFNVLFNLNKFLAFETRDPFTARQEREDAAAGASEWDRFARAEYLRLAVEEEGPGDAEDDAMPWGASLEAAL
jgi:serine/threonine-protein phosphatase 2A regulatory subunit B''